MIFERASRLKLRFQTNKGNLSTEDLWELSLQSLDKLAMGVNKELKEVSEESFIEKKSTANSILELKLDILKAVIAHKQAQAKKVATRAENDAKRAQIKALIADKKNDELKDLSAEDLQKQLDALEAAEV